LSGVRRGCHDDANIDAWSVQIDSIAYSSKYPSRPQSANADLAYRASLGFFAEAARFDLHNILLPGFDSTWYFHFGHDFGLGKCDNTPGNPKSACTSALQADIIDMLRICNANKNATYKIQNKPVLLFYLDAKYASPSEWATIFANARNEVSDFYTIGATENANYFESFDAICPWVNLGRWDEAKGASTYDRALQWVASEHANLFADVGKYPGRVVFGGVAPGFDDYTEDWGNCKAREIPRDPAVLQAEFDYLASKNITGVLLQTWDDWTEGSEFEPDVVGGPSVLVQARQLLGKLFGEPPDPTGDKNLESRWLNYGQARNCKGGNHGDPPVIDLRC